MEELIVPVTNIETYRYLYVIETGLRELIIESLEGISGPVWYKSRLPNDVLEKYRNSKEIEKNIKWTQLIPHHPIYYVDFPDLKKIITRSDNWRDVFKSIFSRDDIINSTLSELEFIRNRTAHNRKIPDTDLTIVKTAFTKIAIAVGKERFINLSARCTAVTDIKQQLSALHEEFEKSYNDCISYMKMNSLDVWQKVSKTWWFDESYLEQNLNAIEIYFKLLSDYAALPRVRGSGASIEAWVKSSDISVNYLNAQSIFTKLLN